MIEPEFLTTEDVLLIHAHQIAQFGGSDGIRDPALLESAVAQAQASYGGEWVHGDLFEMAAAYHFHLMPLSMATNGLGSPPPWYFSN
jgi:death-on-curing protein